MKKKLLGVIAMSMAVMGAQNVKAQTDVTSQYLQNPSFETLKAADGSKDVAVKTKLTDGLLGWTLVETTDYQVESYDSGSSTGFPGNGKIQPTDGTYYYFNRQGWGDKSGEIKTTTSKELEPGYYYVVFDYKAADYTNNNNASRNGTTLGITVRDASDNVLGQTPTVRRSYSMANNGSNPGSDDYMVAKPWDELGAMFKVETASKVTIAINQNLVNYGRSDVIYDNVRLYKIEDDAANINVRGLIANSNDYQSATWSISGGDTYHVNTWSTEGNSDGSEMKTPFIEDWVSGGNKLKDAVISQTLTGLVPGKYKATVLVRVMNEAEAGSEITGAVLYANDKEINVCNGTPTNNNKGKYGTYSLDFVVGMAGDMEIGFKIQNANFNWIAFKNFQLEFVAPLSTADLLPMLNEQLTLAGEVVDKLMNAEVKSALDAAISTADNITEESLVEDVKNALSALETAVKNANASVTEYASFKTNYDKAVAYVSKRVVNLDASYDAEAYNSAIAAVEARYNNGTLGNMDEEVMNVYKALSAAAASQEYKAGVDYSYAIVNNSFETGNLTGWTLPNGTSANTGVYKKEEQAGSGQDVTGADGDYIFISWWAGHPLTQKIEGLPAGKYKLTMSYVGEDPDISGFYVKTNGKVSEKFTTIEKGKFQDVTVETEVAEDGVLDIRIQASTSEGEYNESSFWFWYKVDNFRLTPVVETVNVSVTDAGWATMILPFAAAVPEGMTVYSCDAVDENNILTLNEVKVIEANVPYIVAGEQKEYTFTGANIAKKNEYTTGLLTGVYAETQAPVGSYVLQNQKDGDGVAFYRVEDGADAQPKVKANRAYLQLSASEANVRVITLPGDTDGVESVDAADVLVDVYTMSGIRVRSNVKKSEALNGLKGVYILKAVK